MLRRTLLALVALVLSAAIGAPAVGCSNATGRTDGGDDSGRPDGGDGGSDASSDAGLDASIDGGVGGDDAQAGDAGYVGDAGTEDGWAVLSLNLHCLSLEGTRFDDNEARFAAIADGALSAGVRVLLLQEVCDDGRTDALEALRAAFESASGRTWYGAFAFAHVAWEGTDDEADEGVAILADIPLEDVSITPHRAGAGLRRVMLSAALGDALDNVDVTTFHLDHADAASRRVQARELATAGLVHSGSANTVLGGDLNAREGSDAHDDVLLAGYDDASAALRSTRIDHVFVHRGARVSAAAETLLFDTAAERVSDHPGVLVRLAEQRPAPVTLTTLHFDLDLGPGDALFVRGDQAPLDWTRGWPAVSRGTGRWTFATTELEGSFEFKPLRNDTNWATGANLVSEAGATQTFRDTVFE